MNKHRMLLWLLLAGALLLGLHFLLHRTLLRLPRCTSNVQLHGRTAVVTDEEPGPTAPAHRPILGPGVLSHATKTKPVELKNGSNTGIGKATAKELAQRGARVILACRDQRRAQAAVQEITMETGTQQVIFMHLDLASLKSVRCFAETFLRTESRLDLLINNAGLAKDGRTEDSFGMIFGVNHLGHFLLTVLLLDRLKASGSGRVVTVASKGYELGKIDFECLTTHRDLAQGTSGFQVFMKYCDSKLCNVLFTYELARRLQGSGVCCYSLHPGAIKTDIGRYSSFWWQLVIKPVVFLFFVDAESGAQTTLHCALEQGMEHLSGHYFSQCAPLLDVQAKARDAAVAKKLWELSERFCGLSP
ncbi:retinol dehydrogenase 11-like isoform X2 [Betta splendens]|uniref:Retinol dehydrogenase 11-like isoform X2 n=1 Tax=Betta splendens TaxID=158456 RepID=A0A9W2XJJ1_BETSP|nr:retinol dehydrogenase 11-like isoform X2 [Betta splendens]